MDRKPTSVRDLPRLDAAKLGRTAWDPVLRPDGTRPPIRVPRYQRVILAVFKRIFRER